MNRDDWRMDSNRTKIELLKLLNWKSISISNKQKIKLQKKSTKVINERTFRAT